MTASGFSCLALHTRISNGLHQRCTCDRYNAFYTLFHALSTQNDQCSRLRVRKELSCSPPPPIRFSGRPVSFAFRPSTISLETVSKARLRSKLLPKQRSEVTSSVLVGSGVRRKLSPWRLRCRMDLLPRYAFCSVVFEYRWESLRLGCANATCGLTLVARRRWNAQQTSLLPPHAP